MNKITELLVEQLKKELEEKEYLDVGKGAADHYMVSKDRLFTAVNKLKEEGYVVTFVKLDDRHIMKILTKEKIGKENQCDYRLLP